MYKRLSHQVRYGYLRVGHPLTEVVVHSDEEWPREPSVCRSVFGTLCALHTLSHITVGYSLLISKYTQ